MTCPGHNFIRLGVDEFVWDNLSKALIDDIFKDPAVRTSKFTFILRFKNAYGRDLLREDSISDKGESNLGSISEGDSSTTGAQVSAGNRQDTDNLPVVLPDIEPEILPRTCK